jgi:putative oxidoreductase
MSTFSRLTGGARELNLELLIMRVACSLPFIFHGCAILFGMFGGPGPQGFAAFMHMPVAVGYLVGLAQFAGGIAILLGALLRVGAVCVIIVMLGAIFIVHLPHGYDIAHGGLEYALTELLLALGLLLAGPGRYSLASVLPASLRKL